MKKRKFYPPIEERETDELVAIAHSNTDFWQQEAIDQAKVELVNWDVSKEYQQQLISQWDKENEEFERQWKMQLEANALEEYSIGQQLLIISISPLILLGKVDHDLSLYDLKQENYKIKLNQRRFALIAGVIIYIMLFYLISHSSF